MNKRSLIRLVRRWARKNHVPPPRVIFLKTVPRHVKQYAKLHGIKGPLEGAYYDSRMKAIKILPGTPSSKVKEYVAHEFAHHVQNIRKGLRKTRMKSKTRERIEREADRIARTLLKGEKRRRR